MGGGKCIGELGASVPVAGAARQVLAARLETVRDCLSLVLSPAARDSEHVHQLRVGTRRARTAVDIFACCLPDRIRREVHKHLRTIRRVASEARDWDVLLDGLTRSIREQRKRMSPSLCSLVGYIVAKREMAQTQLEGVGKGDVKAFNRVLKKALASIRKPRAPGPNHLLSLARPVLTALLENLHQAVQLNLEDDRLLHQARILCKRLRYAMEVFIHCYGADFRERYYPAVEEMQEVLGSANDSITACARLETLQANVQSYAPVMWKRLRPGLEGLVHYHRNRLSSERQRFQNLWTHWVESGDKTACHAMIQGG